jgi:hypothetical protein
MSQLGKRRSIHHPLLVVTGIVAGLGALGHELATRVCARFRDMARAP